MAATDKPARQILTEARTTIADAEHWAQHAFATFENGTVTNPNDPAACCRCLEGAVCFAADVRDNFGMTTNRHPNIREAFVAVRTEARLMLAESGHELPHYDTRYATVMLNDGEIRIPELTPHQAVLMALDRAIERLPA